MGSGPKSNAEYGVAMAVELILAPEAEQDIDESMLTISPYVGIEARIRSCPGRHSN